MLEKKVIKYTREGIREENSATGETKMLTLSRYGQELKYQAEDAPECRNHGFSGNAPAHPTVYRRKNRQTYGSAGSSQNLNQNIGHSSFHIQQERDGDSQRVFPSFSNKGSFKGSSRKDTFTKADSRTMQRGETVGSQSTGGYQKFAKSGFHLPNQQSRRFNAKESASEKLRDDDNLGISTVFSYEHGARSGIRHVDAAYKRVSGIRSVFNRYRKRNTVSASTVAKSTSRANTAKAAQATVKKSGNLLASAAKAIASPAVLKVLAIAGAIILALYLLFQTSASMMVMIKGTTTEHPELTAYVEQLDSDFLNKVDTLKEKYEKDRNNMVKIEGDEQINTDPNALAILTTGDWVVMNLTPENKAKMAKFHGLLNTYSVTQKDEKIKEEIPMFTGSAVTIKTKTIHHITIQIQVYTPEEIISQCGYTGEQQKNVLDMLNLLNQIAGDTGGTDSPTGSGYYPAGDGAFHWPVPGHSYISSGYGTRIDPITKATSAFHTGLDIPAPAGTSVLASADGTVIRAGWSSGFGNCVILQHKSGVQTLYGHNSSLVVKKGDTVKQGQVIAKVGSTGRSTGPHCHFEFRINGRHVDPSPYLKGGSRSE